MVLEATVFCLDNSEWMRNGDYTPTRLEAQQDAVNLISGAKTGSNPESTVAIMTSAGRSPEVLVTLTTDIGKILSSLHGLKIHGALDFSSGLQVAQLVLKHRQNKNQHQRIIFFVGSPIRNTKEELVQLGKKLKKNNIAVDIVNFGEEAENTEKLEAFIGAVNKEDNSHLVTIPPGPHILSDILITSPIVSEGGSSGGAASSEDLAAFGGVDPNLDPELALALKLSMEEARLEAQKKKDQEKDQPMETTSSSSQPVHDIKMADQEEEDPELLQAIAFSQGHHQPKTEQQSMEVDDEDEELKMALQMSQQPPGQSEMSSEDISKVMEDPNFVNSVLSSLPGIDPNNDRIKNVLAGILDKKDEKKDEKEDKSKKK